ncbi:MAG: bifunctional diaminohydroxyphosphoribosylaminopyrimidine deaminase/5-amino-6-(5-phosphoribosylamino)uracil reductase RibD [Chloroflexota bacterium]|nr:bifunctional diaminohydroxyphosphoribosylaminopyrimidine deaminase/5-amino-6-(5-phosphoribosylamino)uracil reductase RibD [Chloroflexota bacterium]MDE3194182.1 bifunctional diaminohydroxyphosphoribosylaminopyrimidine deaminase/5-amino-6-(5-phosphoribosylamino)uracil reductase RibD [Chloroflexota bacterium]
MKRALRLAARAAGRTSPNPMVGAVVVKDGAVVGEGFHHRAGEAHGEIVALEKAGDAARGATLYVTLEPCTHQGRTPPCVDRVVAAGVARVVAAMRDPDPRVDGRGMRALKAAGIDAEVGTLEREARRLNEGFIARVEKARPFVVLKLAVTVDGRVAVPGRRYLSGKAAQREVHRMRDRADAVMVGVGTVLADDPELTVREVKGRDPLRVVLDADARTPAAAKIVRAGDPQRTIVFVARDADQRRTKRLRDTGVLLATLPRSEPDGLDAGAGLRWLAEHGVNSVLSEGGPQVASSLLRAGLVDRLALVITPLAGGDGPLALAGLGPPLELRGLRARRLGADLLLEAEL